MCTRCVRFTREVSGSAELQVVSRGSHEEIDIFPGHPVNNPLAGNVVDLSGRGVVQQGLFVPAASLVVEKCVVCVSRLQHRLQRNCGSERRAGLPPAPASE
jgi:hypothetical protein